MHNSINSNNPLNQLTDTKKNDFSNYHTEQTTNPIDLQKNFLSLLIAQIQNQDPIDPIKNTELTSQLAQINTVSGIQKLNSTVETFSSQIHKNQNIQASLLIGRHIMIPSTHVNYNENDMVNFKVKFDRDAKIINIDIKDEKGKVVYHEELNNLKAGTYHSTWDGNNNIDDEPVKSGIYEFSITANNEESNIPVSVSIASLVNSITTYPNQDPIINSYPMLNNKILEIEEILP